MDRYFFRDLFIFVTYVSAIRCGVFLERSSLGATSFLMTDTPEEPCYCPSYNEDFHTTEDVITPPSNIKSTLKQEYQKYIVTDKPVQPVQPVQPVKSGLRRVDEREWSYSSRIYKAMRHRDAIFWSALVGGLAGALAGCVLQG